MPDRYLLPIPMAHGRSGNTGFLSIYFSPRLVAGGALSTYPDWRNWPAARAAFSFQVLINGVSRPYTVVSAVPSPSKWLAVFPGTTPVKEWRHVDRTGTEFRSFDENAFTSSVKDVYGSTAAGSPETPPTVADLLAEPGVNDLLTGDPTQSPLPDAQTYIEPIAEPAKGTEPDVDFHNALMMLGEHPELLRLLGVVVDVEVSLPAAAPSNVGVSTNWGGAFPGSGIAREIPVRMRTSSGFWMLPNPDPLFTAQIDGWTELGNGKWALTHVDALAATQQLSGLAANLDDPDASGALPASDDTGIALLRIGHADALHNEYVRRKQVEDQIKGYIRTGSGGVELFAEDVTQGERIDVKDDVSKTFLSVFQRQADVYSFPRALAENVVPKSDEGWTTFVLTSEQKETYELVSPGGPEEGFDVVEPKALQRVRDAIFVWTGWSSVGPPPGNIIDADGNVIEPPKNVSTTSADVQFEATYKPLPGTLPRLRYGRTYNMRARPVDLSGVSRDVKEIHPPSAESPSELYGRGVVPPPAIVRFAPKDPLPGVGEFVTTVVLLSDYNTKRSDIEPQYRMLLPPTASQSRLELHELPHGGIKPADYQLIAQRDALSTDDECTIDPNSGDLLIIEPKTGVSDPVAYFPDPAASGAAFAGLPLTDKVKVAKWTGNWPDLRSVKLVAQATGRGPRVVKDATGNTLVVTVPKAFDGVVTVSCSIVSSLLSKFGVIDLLSPADRTALRRMMLRGRHWMLSARSELRLVHAVRRPMTKPVITSLVAVRPELGGTDATFTGELALHLDSTDRTMLSAVWEDPVDIRTEPEPGVVPGALSIGSVVGTEVSLTPHFHDTKRHDIEVTAEAFSKFSSYFTEESDLTFTTDEIRLSKFGVVDSSVIISDPRTGDAYVRNQDYTLDAPEGDVVRMVSGAIPTGATVRARFIRLPTSRLSTEDSPDDTYAMSVPAASPPLPLTVREVIPAFSFNQVKRASSVTRARSGAVLRIWTERGWYTSGPGELLGVVIDGSPVGVPVTTRYARDPLVEGPGPVAPSLGNYPRAVSERPQVVSGLDVSGHEPVFDPDRGLWFSDVEIDADIGYRPFVRLSIARYQPIAREGAYLSDIVDLDPLRLGPVRNATVRLTAGGDLQVTLTGTEHDGIPDETSGNALLFNTVSVSFQEKIDDVDDADLEWQTAEGPFDADRTALANGMALWTLQRSTGLDGPIRILIEESEPSMRSDGAGGVQVASEVVYVETFVLKRTFLEG